MRTRIAAAFAAALFALPAAALAQGFAPDARGPVERFAPDYPHPDYPYDVPTTGSIVPPDAIPYDRCLGDSASEGNAGQQNRPVKQYGQTAGGPRC